jgi:FkbM family methyltransferase
MKNRFKKAIANPSKALRYLSVAFKKRILAPKGVLVFIGMDPNGEFNILYSGYKKCYGFEANPDRFEKLMKKYAHHKNIRLFNCAVADYDGEIEFNISSNNNGASSSVGCFNKEWQEKMDIEMIKRIKVPCINLFKSLEKNDITFIDDYISDIQGMDLEVLRTLRPMIEKRQIGSIKCEVTKDAYKNIYKDLPDNSESGFRELLEGNYELVAKGQGLLMDYKFDKIPEEAWEMDCKWNLKGK